MDDKKEKVIFFIKLIYRVIFYRGKRFVVVKNIYFLKFFKKNDFYIKTMSFGFLRGRELFYTPIPAFPRKRGKGLFGWFLQDILSIQAHIYSQNALFMRLWIKIF